MWSDCFKILCIAWWMFNDCCVSCLKTKLRHFFLVFQKSTSWIFSQSKHHDPWFVIFVISHSCYSKKTEENLLLHFLGHFLSFVFKKIITLTFFSTIHIACNYFLTCSTVPSISLLLTIVVKSSFHCFKQFWIALENRISISFITLLHSFFSKHKEFLYWLSIKCLSSDFSSLFFQTWDNLYG